MVRYWVPWVGFVVRLEVFVVAVPRGIQRAGSRLVKISISDSMKKIELLIA